MFCTGCGNEAANGDVYCGTCGKALAGNGTQGSAVAAVTPPPQPAVVMVDHRPYGSPGTGALWLSILGFCGITALLGVILGFVALSEAKRRSASTTKATLAIVIGFVWLVPFAVGAMGSANMWSSASSSSAPATSRPVSGASPTAIVTSASARAVESILVRLKFTCDGAKGVQGWVQCRKGTYDDPVYGPSPVEMVNIWADYESTGTGRVDGYVKPATYKQLHFIAPALTYDGAKTNGTRDVTGALS